MKKISTFIFIISLILMFGCSKEDENPFVRTWWLIQSISPEIESDPNQPDCRMMNDQIFFNDIQQLIWTHPLPDHNGSYDQPCDDGLESQRYKYKVSGSKITIYDEVNNNEVNWDIIVDGDLMTVTRGNTITIYKKTSHNH